MTENEFDRIEHIIDYNLAKQQIDEMQTITFGAEISVLLLTDRLYGCAKGLQEYMQNSTDITVDLADTLAGAKKLIAQKPIDFLIIVGYLKNEEMYQATQELAAANKYSTVIMYAGLDCLIDMHCRRYKIAYKYHRREPISGFISYMRERYAGATVNNNDLAKLVSDILFVIDAETSGDDGIDYRHLYLGLFNGISLVIENAKSYQEVIDALKELQCKAEDYYISQPQL